MDFILRIFGLRSKRVGARPAAIGTAPVRRHGPYVLHRRQIPKYIRGNATFLPQTNENLSSYPITSSRAQNEVFEIAELFGIIISHLDEWTIFSSVQRVSKTWYINTAVSSPLQRSRLRAEIYGEEAVQYQSNIILARFMPIFFCQPGWFLSSITTAQLYTKTGLHDRTWRKRWLNPKASWRRMQVGCPPITKIHWLVWLSADDQTSHIKDATYLATFEFPEGLTMGQLYDLVLGTRGKHTIKWPKRFLSRHCQISTSSLIPSAMPIAVSWMALKCNEADAEDAILVLQEASFDEGPTLWAETLTGDGPRRALGCPETLLPFSSYLTALRRVHWNSESINTSDDRLSQPEDNEALREFCEVAGYRGGPGGISDMDQIPTGIRIHYQSQTSQMN